MLSNNAVVVYFSRTGENYSVGEIEVGNTAKVAQVIASRIGAPTVEVVPVEPYPNVYDEAVAQATQERSAGARPAFTLVAGDGADNPAAMLDSAETIYLGYPIWRSDMPMPVYTFLESRDWSGKTIAPFCTHEGSGLADTVASIRRVVVGATVLDGMELRGAVAQNDVDATVRAVDGWLG